MKAFGGKPKQQVPRGDEALPHRLSPAPALEEEPMGLCLCVHQRLSSSSHQQPPLPDPRQLVCTISFSKQLCLLASREYFASTYAPLLLFIKMD